MGVKKAAGLVLALAVLVAAQPVAALSGSQLPTSTDPTILEDARAVLLVGFSGSRLDPIVKRHLEDGGRGVILFSHNVRSRSQVRRLTAAIACAANAPVLVATDQELGRVQRLRDLVTPTPTPSETVHTSPEDGFSVAEQLGMEMLGLGINMDLAPLLDVVRGPNPVLTGRVYPGDLDTVINYGEAFASGLRSGGVVATAKHFPGHGLARSDPHSVPTLIDADWETLGTDLAPFRSAVDSGIKAIMVGHPIYPALDPNLPASLSPAVLDLLRNDLGFEGVAVTDGLSMRAVRAVGTLPEIAVQALRAGEDLLIIENAIDLPPVVNAVLQAVERGDLDRDRLTEAATRVRELAAWASQPACPQNRPLVRRS